ncbi:MAG TPA: bifunctional 4-hydroxy-2-oxoglutarate aldolase/2-dehydro-3-deoxy-phosphogluconate aldolase [Blastocatellia bacterium]|nr:bifunctional 4-hydroxy-2-oxoglutarate aldolase/2-dehydro-3-deoxy-phosphogluconate aldolase [Blastocatellia bacterium]
MKTEQTFSQIEAGRVIAILRGDFGGREAEMVAAMIEGGLTAVEVTLNSPDALATIGRLAVQFGARCAVGAGTVLTPHEVRQVAEAGGTFIVSPNCDPRVIAETKACQMISLPGAFTPTEIVNAVEAGADAVKLFPATSLGPSYVKAVRAPLSDLRLIPTGGVTPEMAQQYRSAGAWAVGIGSELLGKEILADHSLATLRVRSASFVRAMQGN